MSARPATKNFCERDSDGLHMFVVLFTAVLWQRIEEAELVELRVHSLLLKCMAYDTSLHPSSFSLTH